MMEKYMYWTLDEDGRWIGTADRVTYIIHDTQRRSDFPLTGKYGVCREPCEELYDANVIDDGYLNKDGKIVCGNAIFNAIGLPDDAEYDSVEEAKAVCEKDYEEVLKNGLEKL